ncbi:MAG: MFS transporter [Pseudoxanthomonas sp.]
MSDEAGKPRASTLALLRNRRFTELLAFRLCTIFSYQIVAVTVGWHIYKLTGDTFSLGLVGLAEVLPYLCVAPFAGYLVDHLPRRRLGMAASAALLLTALILVAVALGLVPAKGTWPIYAAIVFTGAARSFLSPIYNAMFARVMPREDYARGAALGGIVFDVGTVLGPALGGLLVGFSGTPLAYAVACGFAGLAIVALALLRVEEPKPAIGGAPIFASIAEGARFVFSQQVMLGAMALDMFSVLLGGVVAMLPAFVHDILHYGPQGLGILRAAPAAGAIVMGLWLARHPPMRHAGRTLLYAVAGFGLCVIAFGLSRHFWLSFAILLAYGACDAVSVVLRTTIMQLITPDEMRGRVSSINGIFISSSNELGAFYAGSMARLLGLIPAVIVGGFAILGVVGITATAAPKLRRLDLRELQ